uniref:UPAR/Ly6 domain-containing protein n=1 Tax=Sinocyclocheilus grahami TaxID=75366 RepID=A0A672M751_SINGR
LQLVLNLQKVRCLMDLLLMGFLVDVRIQFISHFLGGKTIRRCIRYTDCDNSRLSQKFPSISEYTYRCCNTDLCNSGPATVASTWILSLLAVLTGLWSCCITA